MSKFVNITVCTSLSTDFFIEVEDNATEEEIKEKAIKEIQLPNEYPKILDTFLKKNMGIEVKGLDSLLKDWIVDDIEYIINE